MSKKPKAQAIASLEQKLSQLENPDHRNTAWITATSELFRIYLGEKSELYLSMKKFAFASPYGGNHVSETAPKRAEQMIQDAISIIKAQGIYKEKGEHVVWKFLNWVKFWGK